MFSLHYQPYKSTTKFQWKNKCLILGLIVSEMYITANGEDNVRYFVYSDNRLMYYHCASSESRTKWLQLRVTVLHAPRPAGGTVASRPSQTHSKTTSICWPWHYQMANKYCSPSPTDYPHGLCPSTQTLSIHTDSVHPHGLCPSTRSLPAQTIYAAAKIIID